MADHSETAGRACLDGLSSRLKMWEKVPGRISGLVPDFVSSNFDYDSLVPVATVCLRDCIETLGATRYALDRYCEVGAQHRAAGDEVGAVFFEKFYLDDVALRLYSAAEHLANAILSQNEVNDRALTEFRNVSSQWERTRKYLNKYHPQSDVTKAVSLLRQSREWRFTMGYRGRWVHNQPDTVAGLGIRYERKKRWQASDDGTRRLVIGPGDTPKHTTEVLADSVTGAFEAFLPVVNAVIDEHEQILAEAGIETVYEED